MPDLLAPRPPDVLNPDSDSGIVLVCDHASNAVPADLNGGDLGVPADAMDSHIAIDIGAEAVTRALAERLGATAVIATVSRLVCDLNRNPAHQNPFPTHSDGVAVPVNRALSEAERQARLDAYFDPFHDRCGALVAAAAERHPRPLVIAVHSFTPVIAGQPRPWEIAFLHDRDPRLAHAFLSELDARYAFTLGDNEPYSGRELYYTMDRHGQALGIPQTTVEIRQDLLASDAGHGLWADLLAECIDAMPHGQTMRPQPV
ncbi:hypothetical protein CCR85_00395 [Rhodothalassium salexigens]|uniref:N-formylglutamate amidohydrolase n=1 Tax=Rhodothalassium salexigens TaxID=1086 RepID=UPI001912A65B|nr:N-formylglutamate amidohydrolase [Rhodothalassium salexigens]MBK5909953.1 hypothetical protein [Rhodothalassium salexigens]